MQSEKEITLKIVDNMKTITVSQCHNADTIIDNIQERIDQGELETSEIELEVEKILEETIKNIRRYSLEILKIVNSNGKSKQLTEEEYRNILGATLRDELFLDQCKSNKPL